MTDTISSVAGSGVMGGLSFLMKEVDLSFSVPNRDEHLSFVALVDLAGKVLAGHAADHLSGLFRPLTGEPFEAWWSGVCQSQAGSEPAITRAYLQLPDSADCVVDLRITPIPEREELLVQCTPGGTREWAAVHALHAISLALAGADFQGMLAAVRENVLRILPATAFYIGLYDQEAETLDLHEVISHGEAISDKQINPREGLVGWVLANRLALNIQDTQSEALPVALVRGRYDKPPSRSVLVVPLVAQDELVGVLSVQHVEPDRYSDEDLWLLEAVASQTAGAVRAAFLAERTAARLRMLSFLQEFSLRLASSAQLADVARVLAEALGDLIQPDEVRVYLRSKHGTNLDSIFSYTGGEAPRFLESTQKSVDPVVQTVDREGRSVVVSEVRGSTRSLVRTAWTPGALAAYPIQRGDYPLGTFVVLYKEPHLFRQDEQRTLALVALQTAIAVERAHYYADLSSRFEQVAALYALAQQVTGTLDAQGILQLVVHTLRDIFRCRACVVALRIPETDEIAIQAAVGVKAEWQTAARFKVGEGVAGRVVATGKPVYVSDVHASATSLIFDPEVHSVIAVPIAYKDNVIGSLNLDSVQPNAFSPGHERILTIAAAQVAAALEIARLYQAEAERAQKLAEANAELQYMEKVREELIQNLSHELRTPLTYIKGYGSLLQDQDLGPLVTEQIDALTIMLDKADMIQRLIHDVVLLEQISEETLERDYADFDTLIGHAFEMARVVHSAQEIVFVQSLDAPGRTVFVDRGRFSQALDNLINNAIKFTPAGGQVTLSTRVLEAEQAVECRVQDTGIGIPPEHLERIFDRFYQVRDPARKGIGGAGIGLAIVQKVLEAHRGSIRVESEKGKGSTFIFTLPWVEVPAVEVVSTMAKSDSSEAE